MKSMKMNLIDYDKDKNYDKYEHKYAFCKNCEKMCLTEFVFFLGRRRFCCSYRISNHKFIDYHNDQKSKNNRPYHYNYYSYYNEYNNYYSYNNEYNDRIFIKSYHKVYNFLKNCFETFKRIKMENEEINKIILQKENENNIIYTILNENLKNNDKINKFY